MTKSITHIHSSSRFDRTPYSLEAAARRYNSLAELVTYTEVEFERREDALRRANGDLFGLNTGDESNSNDSGISYELARFTSIHDEQFAVSNIRPRKAGGGYRSVPYATISVFVDNEVGEAFVIGVLHTTSAVEGDLYAKNQNLRTMQWLDGVRHTKKRINKLRKQYKAKAGIFVADFNIDFKKTWTRALIKTIAPSYSITWHNVKNIAGGTHGNRLIDATFVSGKMKGHASLLPDDNSSDHRPYIETLVWDLTSSR